jgi:hypothetical protein
MERSTVLGVDGSERVALGVVAAAMALFGGYGLATGAPSTVAYLGTVAGLGIVVVRLQRTAVARGGGLPVPLTFGLAALAAAHLAGGLVRVGDDVLYNASLRWPVLRYDHVVHASGVCLGTLVLWTLVVAPAVTPDARRAAILVSALGGLGLGALNETVEFLTTVVHGGAHVGGYTNTGWDLVCNVVGATAAVYVLGRRAPAAPVTR